MKIRAKLEWLGVTLAFLHKHLKNGKKIFGANYSSWEYGAVSPDRKRKTWCDTIGLALHVDALHGPWSREDGLRQSAGIFWSEEMNSNISRV